LRMAAFDLGPLSLTLERPGECLREAGLYCARFALALRSQVAVKIAAGCNEHCPRKDTINLREDPPFRNFYLA
jgi:hypothetical protein